MSDVCCWRSYVGTFGEPFFTDSSAHFCIICEIKVAAEKNSV